MDSERATSRTEDEVRDSETSDNGSISSTEESTEEIEYVDNKAFLEQNQDNETDGNNDGWQGRTKESFEDIDGEQCLKDESNLTLDDNMGELLDASDEMDDDCEYLEDIKSDDGSSPRSEKMAEELFGKESKEATPNSKKLVSKIEEEKEVENAGGDLSILLEPGRRGWVREVIFSRFIENNVVFVGYLTPEDQEGRRRRLESKKSILSYIAKDKQFSDLATENFCLSKRLLGLGSCFEVSRKSLQNNCGKKEYQQFFTLVEGSSPPTVTCNLCETEDNIVRYCTFSNHMRRHHLPDETCLKCDKDIPSLIFSKHSKVCDGTETKLPQQLRNYSQYYTKLKDTSPTEVSCHLCNCVVFSKGYSYHFLKAHMPCQTCPVCRKDISAANFKKHASLCHGSDTTVATSYQCPTCTKLFRHKRYVVRHLKVCTGHQKETCPSCQKGVKNLEIHKKYCKNLKQQKEACPDCQKEVRNLDIHSMYSCKQKLKTCPECQKEVRNLRIHLKRCGKQKYFCSKCHKISKRCLKSHMKTCGNGSKKLTCNQLIIEAISKSGEGKLTRADICLYITKTYPSYKINKQAISTILTTKKHFVKSPGGEEPAPEVKFSTTQLIVQAISCSKEKRLTLSEINIYIKETYPQYYKSKQTIKNSLSSNRFLKKTDGKSRKDSCKSFLWIINPRKEVYLVGQAFKEHKWKGRKSFLWHINQDHESLALDHNKYKELEVDAVQDNDQIDEKHEDQDEDIKVERE